MTWINKLNVLYVQHVFINESQILKLSKLLLATESQQKSLSACEKFQGKFQFSRSRHFTDETPLQSLQRQFQRQFVSLIESLINYIHENSIYSKLNFCLVFACASVTRCHGGAWKNDTSRRRICKCKFMKYHTKAFTSLFLRLHGSNNARRKIIFMLFNRERAWIFENWCRNYNFLLSRRFSKWWSSKLLLNTENTESLNEKSF